MEWLLTQTIEAGRKSGVIDESSVKGVAVDTTVMEKAIAYLKDGRPPMPMEVMLRVYFLQNWYGLSDPMAEETLYDSDAMRCFAGIELGDDRIPDETTILNFRQRAIVIAVRISHAPANTNFNLDQSQITQDIFLYEISDPPPRTWSGRDHLWTEGLNAALRLWQFEITANPINLDASVED